MDPLISIILPVYNSEKYILECINSILKQDFDQFEVIVIDDGSTDNSVRIIKKIGDRRIRLFQNKHNYIESLNLAYSLAQCKYIVRMDSDDIMLPERLSIQYKYMESHPDVDICGSWAKRFGILNDTIKTETDHSDIVLSLIHHNNIINPSTIIKRDIIINYKLTYKKNYIYAEDYKFWIDCVKAGCKFANINNALINYRCSESQTSMIYSEIASQVALKIRYEYLQYIIDKLCNNILSEEIIVRMANLKQNGILSPSSFIDIISILYREYIIRR